MTISLTLYATNTVSSTVATCGSLLENVTTGAATTNKNSTVGSGVTGWGQVYALGTATAWAAAGSIGSPDDHGWLDDSTTLETFQTASGNYTDTVRLNVGAGTAVVDIRMRLYRRSSGGTKTLIADMSLTGQTLTTTATNFSPTATGVAASATFATGDKVYRDLWINITTNSMGGASTIKVNCPASGSSTGSVNAQDVTPGYQTASTTADKKVATRFFQYVTGIKKVVSRFYQYAVADKAFRTRFYQYTTATKKLTTRFFQLITADKKIATRFRQYAIIDKKAKTRFFQYVTADKKVRTRFNFAAQAQHTIATRFGQYDSQSTAQMLYDDLQSQYIRLRTSSLGGSIQLMAIVYYVSAQILSEHAVPGELDVLLVGEDFSNLHVLKSVKDVSDFIEENMGAQTIYLQTSQLITATSGNSGPLNVSSFKELAVDINISGKQGTSPTIQFFVDRIDASGSPSNLWTSSVYSTVPQAVAKDIGPGLSNQTLGASIQYRWVIGGTSTPGWTYSVSLIAK